MLATVLSFFSTKSVTQKIINHTLSEIQLFLYFYFIMAFDTFNFVQDWINIVGKKLTSSDLIFIYGYFLFTILGLIILFIANGGSKGNKFLAKFFAFSVTIGIKYEIAAEIIIRLPNFISIKIPHYGLISWWVIDLLMLANIAYRMYETRLSKI